MDFRSECKNYYIYEDSDSNIISIQYKNVFSSDYDYIVGVYFDGSINNDVEILEKIECRSGNDLFYIYENKDYTKESKYNFQSDIKRYTIKKKKSTFTKKIEYEINEID